MLTSYPGSSEDVSVESHLVGRINDTGEELKGNCARLIVHLVSFFDVERARCFGEDELLCDELVSEGDNVVEVSDELLEKVKLLKDLFLDLVEVCLLGDATSLYVFVEVL